MLTVTGMADSAKPCILNKVFVDLSTSDKVVTTHSRIRGHYGVSHSRQSKCLKLRNVWGKKMYFTDLLLKEIFAVNLSLDCCHSILAIWHGWNI